MCDVPAPLKRAAVFNAIKGRAPLRMTHKGLKSSGSSAPTVPSGGPPGGIMVPTGSPAAASISSPFGAMDGMQVLQRLLAAIQPPQHDGINLQLFPPRQHQRTPSADAAPREGPSVAPVDDAEVEEDDEDADGVVAEIENLAKGAAGKALMRRPSAAPKLGRPAAATPSTSGTASPKTKKTAAAASTPTKTSPTGKKGKGKGKKGHGKGKQCKGRGKGTPKTQKGMMKLGCSKCRYASGGCAKCKDPNFSGKRGHA